MATGRGRKVRHVAAAAQAVILVCRKCSRKLDGGFGPDGDERLAKALRRSLRARSPSSPRRSACTVLEVGCLDLCPKGSVVVLRGDRPGDWLVVPRGTDLAEIGTALGWPAGSQGER